jgi:hypothetical protein
LGRVLDVSQLRQGVREIRIHQKADEIHRGHELVQQAQPLRAQAQDQQVDPGDIATGSIETRSADSPGARLLRNPTTGIAACCARAASGHAAAAPPSSVMNSRRF